MSRNSINWDAFEEINKLESPNNNISSLKEDVEKALENEDYSELSKILLDLLKEILISSGEGYQNKEELWEDVYWLRYGFVELDDDHDEWALIGDEVMEIFFDFQSNISYMELLNKIRNLKKRIDKNHST